MDVNENVTHKVVLSYLVHNCFKDTVESFVSAMGIQDPPNCLQDMDRRKKIISCVSDGNALKAIELTEQRAPDLLEKNPDLHFDLLSLHFIHLVCSKRCSEAVEFAQKKLTPFGKEQKFIEKLQDFMALLAYEEPEKSPMFHLLSAEYREQVAENLNRTILAYTNQPSFSSLEKLIQQVTVVQQQLNHERENVKDGVQPFSFADFIKK